MWLHVELNLVEFGQGVLEGLSQCLLVVLWQFLLFLVVLHNEFIYHVGIYTGESAATFFLLLASCELLLEEVAHGWVELTIHQEHIVALGIGGINVTVLVVLVVGIEVDQVAVLVCLFALDECLVFLEGVHLAFRILQQGKCLSLIVEVALGEHSIVDENLDVIPFLLKLLAVALEDGGQAVAHLLGDVCGNLLHVGIALQVTAAHVQRNVW